MAAGSTYTPIATTTLGSAANSYTFTSISGSYTDLVLVASVQGSTAAQNLLCQVGNGSVDTATNYSSTWVTGNGSAASSSRLSSRVSASLDSAGYPPISGSYNIVTVNFQNYSNTTTNKTFIARSSSAPTGTDAVVSLWRSTAAINTIKIYLLSNNLAVGTTFTLYGIAAA